MAHPPSGSPRFRPQTMPAAISTSPVSTENAMRSGEDTLSSAAASARLRTGSTNRRAAGKPWPSTSSPPSTSSSPGPGSTSRAIPASSRTPPTTR
ncbi:MAG: hypothetical protein AVDCRST_MAG66-1025 [uncultured Pseudonocardia sp.]|uniref:Uncharacterized protein n=1 Tax=uncultured Pseudonocardia sp. TaxID=211455 RepID=A0A6J4NNU2_9PSEU|nr:MAG: hypothetical protein AVDCRST_MAG66-1025 [uncultured Pseudonocardia sp.]